MPATRACMVTYECSALNLFPIAVTVLHIILGEQQVLPRSIDLSELDQLIDFRKVRWTTLALRCHHMWVDCADFGQSVGDSR